jgi:hypothetical protein
MAAPGAGNPPFGIMVAPSGDVRVAVNETGNAANLEASTASENLPLPSASDVATTASPAVVATPTSARAASSSACRAASTNAMSASAASASLRRREASPRFARMARPTAKRRRMAVSLPPRSDARARARTGSIAANIFTSNTFGLSLSGAGNIIAEKSFAFATARRPTAEHLDRETRQRLAP